MDTAGTDRLIGAGSRPSSRRRGPPERSGSWTPPTRSLDFIDCPDVETTAVISRGGTTTFMSPALMTGVAGLITLQGAPESHLGILSR
jgi:hypothetical protein